MRVSKADDAMKLQLQLQAWSEHCPQRLASMIVDDTTHGGQRGAGDAVKGCCCSLHDQRRRFWTHSDDDFRSWSSCGSRGCYSLAHRLKMAGKLQPQKATIMVAKKQETEMVNRNAAFATSRRDILTRVKFNIAIERIELAFLHDHRFDGGRHRR